MKLKRYLLVVMSLLAGGLSADALYWMVESDNNKAGDFMYAQVKASKGEDSQYLPIFISTPSESANMILADGVPEERTTGNSVGNGDGVWADIGPYGAGWEYTILLFGENGNLIGGSDSLSFENLVTQGSISYQPEGKIEPVYTSTPWSPTFAIPEPTSGLLVLMGLAGLGLRRKVEKLKS